MNLLSALFRLLAQKMFNAGYRVEICYGWEAARDVILDYLGEK